MMKLLGKTVALAVAVHASTVMALGLGDITVKSAINERFAADIELTQTQDLDKSQILVSLAGREEFERAGVERPFYLNGLRFEVVSTGIGEKVLRVSSKDVVLEPYMNFLIEVMWPHGRLLKEYMVLLDLPSLTAAPAKEASSAPSTDNGGGDGRATVTRSSASSTPSASVVSGNKAAVKAAPIKASDIQNGQYRVQQNQSLWNVATAAKVDGESVTQAMNRIFDNNPSAFVNGDINQLKKGAVLNLAAGAGATNAPVQVSAANQAVQASDDATEKALQTITESAVERDAAIPKAGTEITETPSLEAAAQTASDGVEVETTELAASSTSADIAKLEQELAKSFENLDKTELENAQLGERIDNIQEKFNDLEQLIELKDKELSALQDSLTEAGAVEVTTDEVETTANLDSSAQALPANDIPAIEQPSAAIAETATPVSVSSDSATADSSLLVKVIGALIVLAAAVFFWLRRRGNDDEDSEAYDANIFAPVEANDTQRDESLYEPVDLAASLPEEEPQADVASDTHVQSAADEQQQFANSVDEADFDDMLNPEAGIAEAAALAESTDMPQAHTKVNDDLLEDLTLDFSAVDSAAAVPPLDESVSQELDDLHLDLDLDADVDAQQPKANDGIQLAYDADALEGIAAESDDQHPAASNQDFADEVGTKLDLARAYIDMGDIDGAREILDEVMQEGSSDQKDQANEMMSRIA